MKCIVLDWLCIQPPFSFNPFLIQKRIGCFGFNTLVTVISIRPSAGLQGHFKQQHTASRNYRFQFVCSKRAVQQVGLNLRDVEPLLDFIQSVVETILNDRKVIGLDF